MIALSDIEDAEIIANDTLGMDFCFQSWAAVTTGVCREAIWVTSYELESAICRNSIHCRKGGDVKPSRSIRRNGSRPPDGICRCLCASHGPNRTRVSCNCRDRRRWRSAGIQLYCKVYGTAGTVRSGNRDPPSSDCRIEGQCERSTERSSSLRADEVHEKPWSRDINRCGAWNEVRST